MGRTGNDHLNLYNYYDHKGTTPIENNLTRVLAILFQEYPALLLMLLDKVESISRNRNNSNIIYKPNDKYDVNFQVRSTDLGEQVKNIIGIALTTGNYDNSTDGYTYNSNLNGYEPVTDISIEYNDTLIIIEAKVNDTNCMSQLSEQISKTIKNQLDLKNINNINEVNVMTVYISWEEALKIIGLFQGMSNPNSYRMINDYLEHVYAYYPYWFPVKKLSSITIDNKELVEKRLDRIKQEYANAYLKKEEELVYARKSIPLDWEFASEAALYCGGEDHIEDLSKAFILSIWPADTAGQFWRLVSQSSLKFAKNRTTLVKLNSGVNVTILVRPYLKFCHFNKGVMWSRIKDKVAPDVLLKAGKEMVGKWNRNEWGDFINKLRGYGILDAVTMTEFSNQFSERFENSNRNYFTLSMGFEVLAYMPYSEAEKLDAADKLPETIYEILEKLKDIIKK